MHYPLQISFKKLALAPQVRVLDATGAEVCYVKQQLFKLRERVEVYTNAEMVTRLAGIQADRVLDFSAVYHLEDAAGRALGALKRKGMKSLWRPHYEIRVREEVVYTIEAASVWSSVLDGMFSQLPLVGLFSGYVFHPRYEVWNPARQKCFTLQKKPAFFEGRFELRQERPVPDELLVLLSLLMLTLLERQRS